MAATLLVYFDFGGTDATPGTEQDTTSLGPPGIRFKTADNATIDTVNPVPIPSAGTSYSFWKHIYLKCSVAPATMVNNVKFYTDASGFGTGITLNVGDEMPTKNSGSSSGYEVDDDTADASATELSAGHSGITGVTDAYTYTSAATKSISIGESGSLIDAQNETTNYIVLQMAVGTTASAADLSNETLTYRYDEI